jgi:hypothetical protein
MTKNRFDIVVHSEFSCFSCDGQTFHAERFIVQVSNAAGRRCAQFEDVRIHACESAELVAALTRSTLAAGRKLIAADWEEDEPLYGSVEFERRRRLRLEFDV